jgi:hypothetical protein
MLFWGWWYSIRTPWCPTITVDITAPVRPVFMGSMRIIFESIEPVFCQYFFSCLNGILWSKDTRKESKFNIYNALIKSRLLYGSETWRLMENNKRRVEATEMDALIRSSRISRKIELEM